MKEQIEFEVIYYNQLYSIKTYRNEYRNLMELLRNTIYLDGFGECNGMGRCATCVIKIEGLKGNSILKDRNEPITLQKIGNNNDDIRLACQILVTSDLNGSKIEIMDV